MDGVLCRVVVSIQSLLIVKNLASIFSQDYRQIHLASSGSTRVVLNPCNYSFALVRRSS